VRYAFSPDTSPPRVLDGRTLPGIPKHAVHLTLRVEPRGVRGGWLEVETAGTSSTLVDDTLSLRTSPWWTTNVRLGWTGRLGSTSFQPFVAANNVFDRLYVGSVVINAARGRYYEPAPGRNLYLGLTVGTRR
jgi:iron complex outermembrane receptor protein